MIRQLLTESMLLAFLGRLRTVTGRLESQAADSLQRRSRPAPRRDST